MSRLTTRTVSELQSETVEVLEAVKLNGKISDVYLQIANSERALQTYLQMEATLREGSLSTAELEAVKLWVSEQTGCQYCLSIHHFKACQAGLSEVQQLSIRAGKLTGEVRMDALLSIARTVYQTRGSIPQVMLDQAFAAGLVEENLVDLMMAISTIFFTNITNHINDTRLTLPPAPILT